MTTTRRGIDHLVAGLYAAMCFGVVVAPALAVRWTVLRTDVGGVGGRDILAASVVIGIGHAAVAWTRLRCEKRIAARRSHILIASLNALVVLALSASLLVLGVLEMFAAQHAAIANRGVPVVTLWACLQLVAVALAEITGRVVFWWLEPDPEPDRTCRWGVLPPARHLLRPRLTWRLPRRAPIPVQVLDTAPSPTTAHQPAPTDLSS